MGTRRWRHDRFRGYFSVHWCSLQPSCTKVRVLDRVSERLGGTLAQALEPHLAEIAAFADAGSFRLSRHLADLWAMIFPMVRPPATEDGLGVIILNSNAETHFSFTNALGIVSFAQAKVIGMATKHYPRACWNVALHHHVVQYPMAAKGLSERIGTALINGSWLVRRLQRLADHPVVMRGHRHSRAALGAAGAGGDRGCRAVGACGPRRARHR
jgi:hypothetical protein